MSGEKVYAAIGGQSKMKRVSPPDYDPLVVVDAVDALRAKSKGVDVTVTLAGVHKLANTLGYRLVPVEG